MPHDTNMSRVISGDERECLNCHQTFGLGATAEPNHQCSGCGEHDQCCDCRGLPCGCLATQEVSSCNHCSRCPTHCTCVVCRQCTRTLSVENVCSGCFHCLSCCRAYRCNACNQRIHPDSNGNYPFCHACYCCDNHCGCGEQIIKSYSTNPLRFVHFQGHPQHGQYLGVELEVEVWHSHPNEVAKRWNDAAAGFFILKYDGSLRHGFEIVTAPCDLREHHRRWEKLLSDKNLVDDLESEDTSTCGLHVHVSREAVDRLTLGKVIYFVNHDNNRGRIRLIAGRGSSSYAEYELFTKRTRALECGFFGSLRTRQGMRFQQRHNCGLGGRYVVVNPTHKGTVEFRLFKGTLILNDLLARIEFTDAVCHWARQVSLREVTWSSFAAWVHAHKATYRRLIEKL